MRVTLVCGLLGSGKTSFILNTLRDTNERTCVLVNDFGEMGIDSQVLSNGGLQTVELPGGCVCCTLKMDMTQGIRQIAHEMKPDHLVIEPSGMASPATVLDVLDFLKIDPVTVVGLVDVTEFVDCFEQEIFGRFFTEQVSMSDIVIINKVDLAAPELVASTRRLVEELNPRAVVFESVRATLNEPLPDVHARTHNPALMRPHYFNFKSISLTLSSSLDHEGLEGFFHQLAGGACGNIVRAKCLAQTSKGPHKLELSWGNVDIGPMSTPIELGRIVFIGEGIDEGLIKGRLDALLQQ